MANTVIRQNILRGVTLCAALAISAGVSAQAPVYDVNGNDNNLEKRIAILERMVDSRTEMQHRLQQQIDTMQGEVDELRGALEVNTNKLEKVLERQRELYLEIDKRVESLKQAGVGGSTASGPQPVTPVTEPGAGSSQPVASAGQDEAAAYDNAVNLILKSREYDRAIPAFQAFIQRFPNSEFAPNAHYWLGQLLFNKQSWAEAEEQFQIVSNRFSGSTKRPDALLKLGVIAERQGNTSSARDFFQQVISQYPDSSARKLAESRLSGL